MYKATAIKIETIIVHLIKGATSRKIPWCFGSCYAAAVTRLTATAGNVKVNSKVSVRAEEQEM